MRLKVFLSWLLVVFVFILPFATKKFVASFGTRHFELESIFIYFSELVLAAILVVMLMSSTLRHEIMRDARTKPFIVLIIALVLSLILSGLKILALALSLKLILAVALVFVIRRLWSEVLFNRLCIALFLAGIIQTLIAIYHYSYARSFGLKLLGESKLWVLTQGIAKFESSGLPYLRAYGTFPHPNILAAFMVLAIFVSILWLSRTRYRASLLVVAPIGLTLLGTGLTLTFSRLAIALTAAGLVIWIVQAARGRLHFREPFMRVLVAFSIAAMFLVNGLMFGDLIYGRFTTTDSEGLGFRDKLIDATPAIFLSSPISGVGLGNFITHLPVMPAKWMYQPVHNIYLLAGVEIGIVGLVVLGWFIVKSVGNVINLAREYLPMLLVFSAYIVLAFFDHYFWTTEQGRFLWWLALGIIGVLTRHEKALSSG